MIKKVVFVLVVLGALVLPSVASANVVTDWDRTMVTVLEADNAPPPPAARAAAIVQSSVFDAINGIERREHPGARAASRSPRRIAGCRRRRGGRGGPRHPLPGSLVDARPGPGEHGGRAVRRK